MPLQMVLLGLLMVAAGLTAQGQDTAPIAFEVASVKPAPGPPWWSAGTTVSPGRFTATEVPLMSLIIRAYGVPRWKIRNAPEWADKERFTVQATFPPSSTPEQMNAMLRTLLEQRFRLSVQRETRDMDTDVLTLANRDGSLRPGMHPVSADCESKQLRDGSAPGLFPPQSRPACGSVQVSGRLGSAGPARMQMSSTLRYAAITMTDLANALSTSHERPVLDGTGIAGQFDIELDYAWQPAPAATDDPRAVASVSDGAPSLAVALEQQLGLRLRRERNRVELMIVRGAERPRPEEN